MEHMEQYVEKSHHLKRGGRNAFVESMFHPRYFLKFFLDLRG